MKISYDKATNSLYIHLADRASVDSDEVKDGVVLDFDANGALVGIDVQHASEREDIHNVPLSKLPIGELLAAWTTPTPKPDAGGKDFIESLNPNSLKVGTAIVEPSLANAQAGQQFQFERHGYFVADRVDHVQGAKPVFNLAVGLKDSWGK
jgi:uncharacterized protein YuzE